MSALPINHLPLQEQEQEQTEVIYLVVPSSTTIAAPRAPKPFTAIEQLSLALYNFQARSRSASDKGYAIAFALAATAVAIFWAYNVKSAFGIDLFPHQHIENFAPLPGWQR